MKYVTFVAGAISLKHLSPLGTGTLSGGHWTGVREVKKLSWAGFGDCGLLSSEANLVFDFSAAS